MTGPIRRALHRRAYVRRFHRDMVRLRDEVFDGMAELGIIRAALTAAHQATTP